MTQPAAPAAPPVVDPATQPTPPVTPPAAAAPTPPAAAPAEPPVAPAPATGKVEDLPDWAQKLIADTRAEAGKVRTSAKEQAAKEAREELLKQLGLAPDGQPTQTPEQLAEQLAAREAELYSMRVQLALGSAAKTNGADEALVTAVLSHEGKLDTLDTASPTFAAELDALVKAAVEANPKLKAQARAAGASGVEITGGSGEPTQITDPAVIAAMTPEQRVDALEKGHLRVYMAS